MLMATINASTLRIALPDIFRGIHTDPLAPGNPRYPHWLILGLLVGMPAAVGNPGPPGGTDHPAGCRLERSAGRRRRGRGFGRAGPERERPARERAGRRRAHGPQAPLLRGAGAARNASGADQGRPPPLLGGGHRTTGG